MAVREIATVRRQRRNARVRRLREARERQKRVHLERLTRLYQRIYRSPMRGATVGYMNRVHRANVRIQRENQRYARQSLYAGGRRGGRVSYR